jgi:HlyD family secretion protein
VVSYISPKAEFTPRNVQSVEERVTQTFAVKIKLSNARQDVHPGVSADVEL